MRVEVVFQMWNFHTETEWSSEEFFDAETRKEIEDFVAAKDRNTATSDVECVRVNIIGDFCDNDGEPINFKQVGILDIPNVWIWEDGFLK